MRRHHLSQKTVGFGNFLFRYTMEVEISPQMRLDGVYSRCINIGKTIIKAIFAPWTEGSDVKDVRIPQGMKINNEDQITFESGIWLVWFDKRIMCVILRLINRFPYECYRSNPIKSQPSSLKTPNASKLEKAWRDRFLQT